MKIDNEMFSINQLNNMMHALGHTSTGEHRNYYCSGEKVDPSWASLVKRGYAEQYTKFGQYYYVVTDKGKKLINHLIGDIEMKLGRLRSDIIKLNDYIQV